MITAQTEVMAQVRIAGASPVRVLYVACSARKGAENKSTDSTLATRVLRPCHTSALKVKNCASFAL